jgi:hypothetical protein
MDNCRVEYDKIYPHENTMNVISRLDSRWDMGWDAYFEPISYAGNGGYLEIYPKRPSNLLIKLEGPMFILEDIYYCKNGH